MPEHVHDRSAARPAVLLYGAGEVAWNHVSPRLATARTITLLAAALPVAVAAAVVAVVWWPWAWVAVGGVAVAALWVAWIIRRQVSAVSWAELEDEVVIRKGRTLRSLVAIPYGRLQYVDLGSGPLLRAFGLADLTVNTASPQSSGQIPGMPLAEAEALRGRLAERAEAERAGL